MGPPPPKSTNDFPELYLAELGAIRGKRKNRQSAQSAAAPDPSFVIGKGAGSTSPDDPTPENWVTYSPDDLVGLALSGGGIRSATFNLGVLLGLAGAGLLEIFDYLSTVSGGGYIGGWWSAWTARPRAPAGVRPSPFERTVDGRESPQVRHLREFSYFLSPRLGFFSIEFWRTIAALLAAMLPSLAVASAILATILILGFFLCQVPPLVLGLVFFLLLVIFEAWYRSNSDPAGGASLASSVLFHAAAAAGIYFGMTHGPLAIPGPRPGAAFTPDLSVFSPALYANGIVLLEVSVLLFLIRFFLAWATSDHSLEPGRLEFLAALDRVAGRLVALAILWSLTVGVWHLASRVNVKLGHGSSLSSLVASLGSGSLFAWVSKLLSRQPSRPRRPGWRERLRVLLPQIIAYVAVSLAVIAIALALLPLLSPQETVFWLGVNCLGILALALCLFDPNEIGLHAFYRSRIARSYLGASNAAAGPVPDPNRQTDSKPGDDLSLDALSSDLPVHLICCTANDLAGDNLVNLGRDARSAVLSRHGFSMGNAFFPWSSRPAGEVVTLASALTASGAAFNSNMGSKARNFGRAAPFLMSAFGLRLGLWVTTVSGKARLRGRWFYRELFGLTKADRASRPQHLSDGGHFENMGLYELLRRRCRYILVSDCGQDPEVAFDDMGNALRRAREDFGIEIDLDLKPLKPDAGGFSAQHLAAGDIHYPNGYRGILILVKPSLVGDEPDDILQYSTRNGNFPHESTGDQFYDEAQWESYRKLGEHVAFSLFRFAKDESVGTVSELFGRVRSDYSPGPADLQARALEGTAALAHIEELLASAGCEELLRQIYPDLLPAPAAAATGSATPVETTVVTQMIQLMEDTFWRCRLESLWSHPVNMGWVNTFGRWACAPMLRDLWPLLKPMYSPRFTRFAERVLDLPSLEGDRPRARGVRSRVVKRLRPSDSPLAVRLEALRSDFVTAGRTVYVLELQLDGGRKVEVALVLVRDTQGGATAAWTSEDFIVPISLWKAGIGKLFLQELARELLRRQPYRRLEVIVESRASAEATTRPSADIVQMYVEEGFRYAKPPVPGMERTELFLTEAELAGP